MKVVIDTNIFVSRAMSNRGSPARIIEKWVGGAFELVVSEDILTEYERALGYSRVREHGVITSQEIDSLISKIREAGTFVMSSGSLNLISKDPDDNKFLECAVAGGANYIVSGDAHLLSIGQYEGTKIVTPIDFLSILEQA